MIQKDLNVIRLSEYMKYFSEEEVSSLLTSFLSRDETNNKVHEVQHFLHTKAIEFEKSEQASTYLVLSDQNKLLGYFSISIHVPMSISQKNFEKLNNKTQKSLKHAMWNQFSNKKTKFIKSVLIGQLGKNFAVKPNVITGEMLMDIAKGIISNLHRAVPLGRYVYVHCENNPKLMKFYEDNGFIQMFRDEKNELEVFASKIDKL